MKGETTQILEKLLHIINANLVSCPINNLHKRVGCAIGFPSCDGGTQRDGTTEEAGDSPVRFGAHNVA
jgi:hypothetical protein